MLRSFRVVNHKSFRDEAELLLMPAYDKSRTVVPVAGIFGANASGKSNLLDALRWLQSAVRESYPRWEPGAGVPRAPFRLDPASSAAPSLYCVELVLDEGSYTYGLEINDEHVIEEWLYTYPHNRKRIIFERTNGKVRLGSSVPDYRTRGSQLARQTRDNALLLNVAAQNDLDVVLPVYNWFRVGIRFATSDIVGDELLRRLGDEQQRSTVVELVGAADLGISDVTGHREELSRAAARASLRELLSSPDFVEALDGAKDSPLAALMKQQLADPATREGFIEKLYDTFDSHPDLGPGRRLRFHHGKSRVPLALEDQSDGTRSWIGLISAALDAITTGSLIIADEIEASLHPHLTARLINLFRDSETNPGGAQLIFATHDVTLLDDDVLARDEVWFVEKEPDSGATRLYPLTDFHPRKNEDIEGRYLAGGYGAIPIVTDSRFRRAVRTGRLRDAAA